MPQVPCHLRLLRYVLTLVGSLCVGTKRVLNAFCCTVLVPNSAQRSGWKMLCSHSLQALLPAKGVLHNERPASRNTETRASGGRCLDATHRAQQREPQQT